MLKFNQEVYEILNLGSWKKGESERVELMDGHEIRWPNDTTTGFTEIRERKKINIQKKKRKYLIIGWINGGNQRTSTFPNAISIATKVTRTNSNLLEELVFFLLETHL